MNVTVAKSHLDAAIEHLISGLERECGIRGEIFSQGVGAPFGIQYVRIADRVPVGGCDWHNGFYLIADDLDPRTKGAIEAHCTLYYATRP